MQCSWVELQTAKHDIHGVYNPRDLNCCLQKLPVTKRSSTMKNPLRLCRALLICLSTLTSSVHVNAQTQTGLPIQAPSQNSQQTSSQINTLPLYAQNVAAGNSPPPSPAQNASRASPKPQVVAPAPEPEVEPPKLGASLKFRSTVMVFQLSIPLLYMGKVKISSYPLFDLTVPTPEVNPVAEPVSQSALARRRQLDQVGKL